MAENKIKLAETEEKLKLSVLNTNKGNNSPKGSLCRTLFFKPNLKTVQQMVL